MSWNDILISVVSLVLTTFASWASATFIAWLNDKLKDRKSQRFIADAYMIAENCVKATYQTYVEAIKGTDLWTKEAQQKALQMALDSAKAQLKGSTTNYISNNFGDLDTYLVGLIEAILYDLKN